MGARGIHIPKESSVLTTEPWGGVEQDSFVNQVIGSRNLATQHQPLKETLLAIESEMGRVRVGALGPSSLIDFGPTLCGGPDHYTTDELHLPHPYI